MLRSVAAVLLACLLCPVYSQPSATRLFPQHLKATEVDKKCDASADHASVVLHWEPADLGKFSVMGYKVQVYHPNGTTEEATLPHDAREFKYDGATCNGTTVFGVSAVTVLSAGYTGETEGLFVYPAAYVNVSRVGKATRLFPQHLKATEVDKKCDASADHASVVLHWEPADLGNFSVMGYKVQVYHPNGTTEEVTLPHDAREFKYKGATCYGTTVFGVSAVTVLSAGYPGETEGLFVYPAAYVNVSREAKAPVVRNLKAQVRGATSVLVEWTTADGHEVEYKVCAEALDATPVTVRTKDTSATLNDLAPDTEYKIKVSTVACEGSGADDDSYVWTTATTSALQPPSDVNVHATCDHRVIASWKPSGGKLSGFQLKLCDKNQQTCGNKTVSAMENTANFSVSSGQKRYTVHIQSCVMNNKWHCSKPVVKDVSAFGEDPLVRDLQARFINDTSLNVTWGTAHVGKIHITVCPTSISPRNCTSYTTDGDVLTYRIDNIGNDTAYDVHAKFSTSVGHTECFHDESSVNVKRPAPGGRNSASSSSTCVVLMLTLLLVAVMKSC